MAYHELVAEEYIIRDLETLKAISHPLRIQLLKLIKQPKTVKEIASSLEMPPTKLYYHINLLEKNGIIRVVETQIVSGIIEKTYLISAKRYHVDEHLLSDEDISEENVDALLGAVLDSTKEEMKRSFWAGLIELKEDEKKPRKGGLARGHLQLTEAEAIEFYSRLEKLFDECKSPHNKDEKEYPEYKTYGLTIAFYPVIEASASID